MSNKLDVELQVWRFFEPKYYLVVVHTSYYIKMS